MAIEKRKGNSWSCTVDFRCKGPTGVFMKLKILASVRISNFSFYADIINTSAQFSGDWKSYRLLSSSLTGGVFAEVYDSFLVDGDIGNVFVEIWDFDMTQRLATYTMPMAYIYRK